MPHSAPNFWRRLIAADCPPPISPVNSGSITPLFAPGGGNEIRPKALCLLLKWNWLRLPRASSWTPPSRAARCLDSLLGSGYQGKLQSDGYSAYPAFVKNKAVELFGCWAHYPN
jgi:hypothetical protein